MIRWCFEYQTTEDSRYHIAYATGDTFAEAARQLLAQRRSVSRYCILWASESGVFLSGLDRKWIPAGAEAVPSSDP